MSRTDPVSLRTRVLGQGPWDYTPATVMLLEGTGCRVPWRPRIYLVLNKCILILMKAMPYLPS